MNKELNYQKMIINCGARSGSTMLVHLLRSHPDTLIHGEVILKNRVGAIQGSYARKIKNDPEYAETLGDFMNLHPREFINQYLFDSQGKQVVGFKYKWDESLNDHWQKFSEVIFSDIEIFVIHLRRKNLLHQYISSIAVNKFGMPTLMHTRDIEVDIPKFMIDFDSLETYCKDVVNCEIRTADIYKNHRSMTLVYEDIIDFDSESLKELQIMMGLNPVRLSTTTRKNISDVNKVVINYSEAQNWFKKSKYFNRLV